MEDKTDLTRRNVLTAASGAIAAAGLTGLAGAASGTVEVNVGFSNPSGRKAAEQAADSVKRRFNFDAMTIEVPSTAIDGLQNNPNIRYVEENGEMHALAQQTPWGIDRVDADVAHADGETGSGAEIAILDTGIDSDHYDLADNIGGGECFTADCCGESGGCRYGIKPNDNECHHPWDDDGDHGTHCSGSANAIDNSEGVVGVSTEATLYAGKVLDGCGSGSFDAIAAGIEWAADQGFDVASMSLGASSGSSAVKDACVYAYDKGVLLVAAAGNDGPCSDCVGYPAAYEEVIAVSATSEDDSLADFSSTGPEVEIAAPGEDVLSTVPPESSSDGLDTFSGTSMACPHVSGAGAQLMANGYTNTEARQQLQDTAEDLGLASNEQGAGLLDVEAALGGGGDDGGDDTAPSVSWVNPADGETVSDTVAVQISASDSEDSDDSLDVTYAVDGGSARTATYDSTSGYYEDSWDSTGVSDGDHTLEATATDSAGNTSSSSITVTTDNSSDGGDTAPAIDEFAISNQSNGGWARFEVSWSVSDADGDLASVDLTMEQNGTVDSASYDVSGSSASGSTRLEDKKGSGSYDITLTVTDASGNSTSQTKTVSA